MKICVISPVSHLNQYAELGHMDMSLSHIICQHPTGEYASYYRERARRGVWVLLDCSAFELEATGQGLGADPVLDAAACTLPSEVICTDILFEGNATVESARAFIARAKQRGFIAANGDKQFRLMGVVQGRSTEEWFDCYQKLLCIEELDTIGFSKLSVPECWLGRHTGPAHVTQARLACVEECVTRGLQADKWGKYVHLLGGDNHWGYELAMQKKHKWIRSSDSSMPTWYGAHQIQLDPYTGKVADYIHEKPDLECAKSQTSQMMAEGAIFIYHNIATVLRLVSYDSDFTCERKA